VSDLIVLAFDTENGALEMRDTMVGLQKQHIVELDDAAVVIRRADGKVKVKQAVSLVGQGALGGAFWGMLIGIIFLMPWLGLAMGALGGVLGGKMTDTGVDDKFIKEVGEKIKPGHSALFLLIRSATKDKLEEKLKNYRVTVIQTSLSYEDEARLRDLFGAEDVEA
jgi:uncharacterized membrane protein